MQKQLDAELNAEMEQQLEIMKKAAEAFNTACEKYGSMVRVTYTIGVPWMDNPDGPTAA
jgi:hypothetical protein